MLEYPKFKVCVRCQTFNQMGYIRDALHGFTIQKTDFPFICCIIDDASTDDEPFVILNFLDEFFDYPAGPILCKKETSYARIIYAQHKINKNCFFAVLLLKENHYSKKQLYKVNEYLKEWRYDCRYEAFCEGDDYWVREDKLQKQVNLMDSDRLYSMCFTGNYRLEQSGTLIENRYLPYSCSECGIEDYINRKGDSSDTCTLMLRKDVYDNKPQWRMNSPVGDIPMKLVSFHSGKVGYINDLTGVYRLNASSSWSEKMYSNRAFRFSNHKAIVKMWKAFDIWSENKYHASICRKIVYLKLRFLKCELHFLLKGIYSLVQE